MATFANLASGSFSCFASLKAFMPLSNLILERQTSKTSNLFVFMQICAIFSQILAVFIFFTVLYASSNLPQAINKENSIKALVISSSIFSKPWKNCIFFTEREHLVMGSGIDDIKYISGACSPNIP